MVGFGVFGLGSNYWGNGMNNWVFLRTFSIKNYHLIVGPRP